MVDVHIVHPRDRAIAMEPLDGDYFSAVVDEIAPGARYLYCLDGRTERPDPASRFQPQGVHGPSEVVDAVLAWTDIEHYGQALFVAGVYESLQSGWAPVGVLHSIRVDPVVAPVPVSGKLRYWHEFDCGDSQIPQFTNAGKNCVEGSLRRECSDVKLV
jgi:1,4-alpha-glucan branching enzyme